jgi:secondary thiamine-phosphate synthase enzyme
MQQALRRVEMATDRIGLVDITAEVNAAVGETGIRSGLATLFCRHTSASLLIQENADRAVPADIESWFERAVPEAPELYLHDEGAGPDDPPSHIRSSLTATTLGIPIESGLLMLGRWQAVFLFEHRRDGRTREIVVHVIGE